MLRIVGLIVLTISFSFNHVAFADCFSTCNCRGTWDVIDYGCQWTELGCGTQGGAFPNCNVLGNHCCYYEFAFCPNSGCNYFYFRKCYVGGCTYT